MAQQIKITQTSNADMNIGVTKKITAVEWLYERVSDLQGTNPYLDMEFEQAKQMEKEQIINAHTRAYLIGEDTISIEDANNASEQYYNQTYGENKD